MVSQGEKEVSTILSGTLNNTRLLIMFGVFACAFLIGNSMTDPNMKICFWLSLILVIIALINLNLAVSFYIKLRNDKGIEGARGEQGDKGPKGFPGRCELNLDGQCDIKNCRAKVTNKLMDLCPHYGEIVSKRDVDRTVEEHSLLRKYEAWIQVINGQCPGEQDEEGFFQKIFEDNSKYCLVT